MQGLDFSFLERERVAFLKVFGRSDSLFSTEQEGNLLYVAKTTRRHRFGGGPTTPRGRDLFLLVLIFI